jgi:hypothetical protein
MAEGKRTLPSTILNECVRMEAVTMDLGEERAGDALFVDLHGVLVPEGGLADEEFIN